MPDIHWSELLVVGVIALVVLGPKDFAKGMRTLGKWTREARIAMYKTRAMLDAAAMEADILEERATQKRPHDATTAIEKDSEDTSKG